MATHQIVKAQLFFTVKVRAATEVAETATETRAKSPFIADKPVGVLLIEIVEVRGDGRDS